MEWVDFLLLIYILSNNIQVTRIKKGRDSNYNWWFFFLNKKVKILFTLKLIEKYLDVYGVIQ